MLTQRLFDEFKRLLRFFALFLGSFLFLFCFEAQITSRNGLEFFLLILCQRLRYETIDLIGHEQHIAALLLQLFHLRQLEQRLAALAVGIVNILLILRHGSDVFLERDQLALLARPVEQQILKRFLLCAIIGQNAVLDLRAEGCEELFVFLTVVVHQLLQFGLDLLFEVSCDEFQLTVVLEHLTGNIQTQILRIDHAAHEAEAVRQQISAVFHDHHAGGIQLQTLLEVFGVEVIRRFRGDEQQGLVCDRTFDVRVDDG